MVEPYEQMEFPTRFSTSDLARFVAMVAHCHAIDTRGVSACSEYFLPQYALGNRDGDGDGDGALTYVGGASSPVLGTLIPGGDLHALIDRVQDEYLSVNIQLFRDGGDPPPIDEVIVGKLAV